MAQCRWKSQLYLHSGGNLAIPTQWRWKTQLYLHNGGGRLNHTCTVEVEDTTIPAQWKTQPCWHSADGRLNYSCTVEVTWPYLHNGGGRPNYTCTVEVEDSAVEEVALADSGVISFSLGTKKMYLCSCTSSLLCNIHTTICTRCAWNWGSSRAFSSYAHVQLIGHTDILVVTLLTWWRIWDLFINQRLVLSNVQACTQTESCTLTHTHIHTHTHKYVYTNTHTHTDADQLLFFVASKINSHPIKQGKLQAFYVIHLTVTTYTINIHMCIAHTNIPGRVLDVYNILKSEENCCSGLDNQSTCTPLSPSQTLPPPKHI